MWKKSVRDCLAACSGFSFSCASFVISHLLVLLMCTGLWEFISCLYAQLNLPRQASSILWCLFGHQGDSFQMLIRFCNVLFQSPAQSLAQKVESSFRPVHLSVFTAQCLLHVGPSQVLDIGSHLFPVTAQAASLLRAGWGQSLKASMRTLIHCSGCHVPFSDVPAELLRFTFHFSEIPASLGDGT